jgi:3-isopropylmalate/(R)-2-methylmalate dehydratase small subunit
VWINNCYKNGIVPIVLPGNEVEALFQQVEATPGYKLVVDLPSQVVIRPVGCGIPFQIDAFRKECLLNGWDDIGLPPRHTAKIREFEEKRRIGQPWLFA